MTVSLTFLFCVCVVLETKAKPKYYKLARDNTTACLGIDLNSINGSTDEPDFLKESEATRIVGDSYYSKAAIMSTYDQCPTLGTVYPTKKEEQP